MEKRPSLLPSKRPAKAGGGIPGRASGREGGKEWEGCWAGTSPPPPPPLPVRQAPVGIQRPPGREPSAQAASREGLTPVAETLRVGVDPRPVTRFFEARAPTLCPPRPHRHGVWEGDGAGHALAPPAGPQGPQLPPCRPAEVAAPPGLGAPLLPAVAEDGPRGGALGRAHGHPPGAGLRRGGRTPAPVRPLLCLCGVLRVLLPGHRPRRDPGPHGHHVPPGLLLHLPGACLRRAARLPVRLRAASHALPVPGVPAGLHLLPRHQRFHLRCCHHHRRRADQEPARTAARPPTVLPAALPHLPQPRGDQGGRRRAGAGLPAAAAAAAADAGPRAPRAPQHAPRRAAQPRAGLDGHDRPQCPGGVRRRPDGVLLRRGRLPAFRSHWGDSPGAPAGAGPPLLIDHGQRDGLLHPDGPGHGGRAGRGAADGPAGEHRRGQGLRVSEQLPHRRQPGAAVHRPDQRPGLLLLLLPGHRQLRTDGRERPVGGVHPCGGPGDRGSGAAVAGLPDLALLLHPQGRAGGRHHHGRGPTAGRGDRPDAVAREEAGPAAPERDLPALSLGGAVRHPGGHAGVAADPPALRGQARLAGVRVAGAGGAAGRRPALPRRRGPARGGGEPCPGSVPAALRGPGVQPRVQPRLHGGAGARGAAGGLPAARPHPRPRRPAGARAPCPAVR